MRVCRRKYFAHTHVCLCYHTHPFPVSTHVNSVGLQPASKSMWENQSMNSRSKSTVRIIFSATAMTSDVSNPVPWIWRLPGSKALLSHLCNGKWGGFVIAFDSSRPLSTPFYLTCATNVFKDHSTSVAVYTQQSLKCVHLKNNWIALPGIASQDSRLCSDTSG